MARACDPGIAGKGGGDSGRSAFSLAIDRLRATRRQRGLLTVTACGCSTVTHCLAGADSQTACRQARLACVRQRHPVQAHVCRLVRRGFCAGPNRPSMKELSLWCAAHMSTSEPPSSNSYAERFDLSALWEVVRDCRRRVAKSFGYLECEVEEALTIAVAELAENVIKYGVLEGKEPAYVMIRVTPNGIQVRSENAVRSDYDARLACRLVAKVTAETQGRDATLVYADAIARTLSGSRSHSRQGFYRMAAVGGFQLRAERDGKRLTIIGERTR
jgi:hypothetical protein